jgi:hypothetical protein
VGLNSQKSLNLTNVYPNNKKNNNKNNNNKVKSKPLELFELAGKNPTIFSSGCARTWTGVTCTCNISAVFDCKATDGWEPVVECSAIGKTDQVKCQSIKVQCTLIFVKEHNFKIGAFL